MAAMWPLVAGAAIAVVGDAACTEAGSPQDCRCKHMVRRRGSGTWEDVSTTWPALPDDVIQGCRSQVSGTCTSDVQRMAGFSEFPLVVTFIDGAGNQHRISLFNENDGHVISVPVSSRQIYFQSKGNQDTRVGFDAETEVGELTFSYQPRSFGLSDGIRIYFRGFKR
eukprot:TRINITY_DN49679_c0_g1_i1.p1 TRINITY_DN49679_c0_g1~~TRINITY_DN49679_c0_g1_i1.p1  ORF type:complete len:167 (-),score=17.23 TRINITY_DN49679_c0_g1_i1:222-722(-)